MSKRIDDDYQVFAAAYRFTDESTPSHLVVQYGVGRALQKGILLCYECTLLRRTSSLLVGSD